MTEAGRMDLIRRMHRLGCQVYVSELAQGARTDKAEVDEALELLQARGLVAPATWKLTALGREVGS